MSQLPVYSPITIGSLLAGAGALLGGGGRARQRVLDRLVREYAAPGGVVLTESGTGALTLALQGAAAAAPAPLVALPAYGCFDLGTAATGAGVRVVFYDLVPGTLGPDWASLERALQAGAAAVVVAHWYGVPAHMDRVAQLAANYGAAVIDDAAQGVGASVGGRPAGSLGDLGVLSFGRGKGRTGGGGGALLATTPRGAQLMDLVRSRPAPPSRGMSQALALEAQWLLARPSLYWIPSSLPFLRLGETPWHDPVPVRDMPASSAAALDANWDAALAEVPRRRAAAGKWRARLPGLEWPDSEAPGALRGELRLPVLAPSRAERDRMVQTVPGAMPGYPMALPDLPQLQQVIASGAGMPGAQVLVDRLWTLPAHRWV